MRAARLRPSSQNGTPAQLSAAGLPSRKTFNCIVDDSALVAGVKRSTRNGIRQWVKNGQIRLFVPLHALEQLRRQKNGSNRHADDVRETLQWLDDATSRYPDVVTLQGADETYERWAEVEKFVVPRTLFSEDDALDDTEQEPEPAVEALTEESMNRLSLQDVIRKTSVSSADSNRSCSLSPSSLRSARSSADEMSPPTSPLKANMSPALSRAPLSAPAMASSKTVPPRLQPLFNYILWRVHQEVDPVAALESFIFLCNDQSKVHHAKGFEIKTKRLEQLREAIGREDRDFKNRQTMLNRENQNTPSAATFRAPDDDEDDSDDDNEEIPYKSPPRAPAAMLPKSPPMTNVLDPDAFARHPPPAAQQVRSPRLANVSPVVAGRGGSHVPFPSRGNSRGAFRGRGRGRGNFGRGGFVPPHRADLGGAPNGQIDPNSFARPRESGPTGRGERKLWVPT